jgi:hypothetical protein
MSIDKRARDLAFCALLVLLSLATPALAERDRGADPAKRARVEQQMKRVRAENPAQTGRLGTGQGS